MKFFDKCDRQLYFGLLKFIDMNSYFFLTFNCDSLNDDFWSSLKFAFVSNKRKKYCLYILLDHFELFG